MKKISLLSLVFITGFSVYAQDQTTPALKTPMSKAIRFGLSAGVNMAKFNENNFPSGFSPKTSTKTSFNGGVFVNIPIGGMFKLQPELIYNGYGSKLDVSGQKYEQDLSYISLPIMLQYKATGGFFVEAGPQASFLLNGKLDGVADDPDNKDDFDGLDVGAGVGLGYLSRIGLGVNARYIFGLTNIIDEGNVDDGPEYKNRVFQIGLVYQIGAGK